MLVNEVPPPSQLHQINQHAEVDVRLALPKLFRHDCRISSGSADILQSGEGRARWRAHDAERLGGPYELPHPTLDRRICEVPCSTSLGIVHGEI